MGNAGGTRTRHDDDARLVAKFEEEFTRPDYTPWLAPPSAAAQWLGISKQRLYWYGKQHGEKVRHGSHYDLRAVAYFITRGSVRRGGKTNVR